MLKRASRLPREIFVQLSEYQEYYRAHSRQARRAQEQRVHASHRIALFVAIVLFPLFLVERALREVRANLLYLFQDFFKDVLNGDRDAAAYPSDSQRLRASNDDKFRRAIKKLNVLNFFRGPAAQILPAPETPKEDEPNGSFGGTGFAGPLPSRRGSVHPGQLRRAP